MGRIKGIDITLIDQVETGKDPFDRPIYDNVEIIVKNVLVAPVSADDIVNNLELEGKKAVYALGIPKGDDNEWENKHVKFFGKTWRVFGKPTQGIESLMPLDWNKKVMVELYE